jgi:hypothetical protein
MTVQIRNPELIRLLAADFVTRRELVTTPGNRVTLTNTDLTVAGGGALTLSAAGAYTLTVPETGTVALLTATQTLTNKTLTTPTISNFTNAAHNHSSAAGGGQLSLTTAVTGILPPANGGTGVNNATRTLTVNTNSGTLAFGAASKTLTINENLNLSGASGQTLTLTNSLTAQGGGNTVLSSAGNYTLTIPATGTVALLGTANVFTAAQTFNAAVGISTSSPVGNFDAVVDGNGGTFRRYGGSPSMQFARANGTLASPTQVNAAATIGAFGATALDNAGAYQTVGLIRFNSESATTSTSAEGSIAIQTTPAGSIAPATRMTIASDGDVGIGTTAPSALLHVNQSSTTAAIPTLRLRQAGLSEEFIRFEATVGAGNPINTTALGTYYGRVRVWVEGVGAKWLALYD